MAFHWFHRNNAEDTFKSAQNAYKLIFIQFALFHLIYDLFPIYQHLKSPCFIFLLYIYNLLLHFYLSFLGTLEELYLSFPSITLILFSAVLILLFIASHMDFNVLYYILNFFTIFFFFYGFNSTLSHLIVFSAHNHPTAFCPSFIWAIVGGLHFLKIFNVISPFLYPATLFSRLSYIFPVYWSLNKERSTQTWCLLWATPGRSGHWLQI